MCNYFVHYTTKPKKKVVQVSSCTSVLLRSNHIKYFFILAWDVIDKMVGLLLVNPTGSALMAWRRMVRNGQVVMEISWIFAQLADADPSAALGDNEVQE